jgi:glycosyltransferase involved in cell wall biosynthesis
MRVSVILTTASAAAWLRKVLWGYRVQSHQEFELIIADDGSGPEVALLLQAFRCQTRRQVVHVWQPRAGFRKCQILNQAIRAATGDYLIFSDGDCIPSRDFVATHVRLARPGLGMSGGCIRLPQGLSHGLTEQDIFCGRYQRPSWLWKNGLQSLPGLRKVTLAATGLGAWADGFTSTRATFNGHNASVWRTDALQVNGFDERMAYGGLDREFGERLQHAGVQFRQVRHQAICLHLFHTRPYATVDSWQNNQMIRNETRGSGRFWTPYGIEQVGRLDTGPRLVG